MKSVKSKKILGVVILAVLIVAMAFTFNAFKEKPVEGEKNITIEVVAEDKTSTVYEVDTDAEYLLGAMEDADGLTFEGEDGPYGMSVSTVNGVRADYTLDGAYWAFFVGEEYCNYGVSQQPVEDGDSFKIVYTLAE
ncbi:MAG: DUF4430 domain-containing protein [Clostridia bacterium]|nr:DUF4430 domain-containing protein [Clostridia bacterium]